MGFTSQSIVAQVQRARTPLVTNFVTTLAATEYSHALQDELKTLIVRARGNAELRIAFVATETSNNYLTISKGGALVLSELDFRSKTLYIRSSVAAEIVEILELY